MKTLLVTGGAGFIGGNFVLNLVADSNYRVINLDALTYAGHTQTLASVWEHDLHHFVHGSINDHALVKQLFVDYKPDAIINFAAESHVDRSIDGPAMFLQTNVLGTLNLLEISLAYWNELASDEQKKFRFLHISTDEVYGSLAETGLFTERSNYAPNSPYAASKAAADHLVRSFNKTYGLPTLTTNCSNNYGPYQFPEKLIPLVIQRALDEEKIPVYGDGKQIRDWLYVNDHCHAISLVLAAGKIGETYNIGGNEERTNLSVVELICQQLDQCRPRSSGQSRSELITFVADRPGHDRRYAIDASKIKKELGWEPAETFATGMGKTIDWYLKNQTWCDAVLNNNYDGKRLGVATS